MGGLSSLCVHKTKNTEAQLYEGECLIEMEALNKTQDKIISKYICVMVNFMSTWLGHGTQFLINTSLDVAVKLF